MKNKVLKVLRREVDKKDYRQTVKECKVISKEAKKGWVVGNS